MSKVSKEQIADWTENPVTIHLKTALESYKTELGESRGLDAFHPFEAHRTQEILANLNGAVDMLDELIDALDGMGILMEEEDEDGDIP